MGGVSADGRVLWLSGRYNADVYAISTAQRQAARAHPRRQRPARPLRLAAARPLLARTHRASSADQGRDSRRGAGRFRGHLRSHGLRGSRLDQAARLRGGSEIYARSCAGCRALDGRVRAVHRGGGPSIESQPRRSRRFARAMPVRPPLTVAHRTPSRATSTPPRAVATADAVFLSCPAWTRTPRLYTALYADSAAPGAAQSGPRSASRRSTSAATSSAAASWRR